MKRALLSEMAHEWKNNIWLIIEFAIVALAIWAILTMLWMQCHGLFMPRGFNPERVYTLDVKSIPENSPYFLEEYKDNYFEDRNELINRLRKNPNVDYVSLHNNFAPYEYSYSGNGFNIEGYPDSIGLGVNVRTAEADIIKVMDIQSLTGKSQDALAAMLERGEVLISPNERWETLVGPVTDLIGKYIYSSNDNKWKVGDVVQTVKRSDYEYDDRGVIIMPFSNIHSQWGDIILKVKPDREEAFIQDFNSDPSLNKLRNVYLSNLKSLVEKGKALHREVEVDISLLVAISFFLLLTIFLGLLGSFWFRVQQRVSEIAIRKTFGATNYDLFRRIIGEGMILLCVALVLISVCVWPFTYDLTNFLEEKWWTLLATEAIAAGMMTIGIILSLLYPAWRAMHIEPAIAVKEE